MGANNISVHVENKADDFYLKIRNRILKWFEKGRLNKKSGKWTDLFLEYLLFLPDLSHLMFKLFTDRDISPGTKGLILAGFTYLISPVDFIPDFIPVAGLIDDLLVVSVILNKIINSADEVTTGKIKLYWAGEEDVFKKVKEIVKLINDYSAQIPKAFSRFLKKRS